jgi:arabinan endo-1,5-alpha-L-arabinosidase
VTDGPFLYRCSHGALIMIWSSFSNDRYAQGVATSDSGDILGPWTQNSKPLYESDGGHGMIFKTFEGQLMLTLHSPNHTPNERVVFIELKEDGDSIQLR